MNYGLKCLQSWPRQRQKKEAENQQRCSRACGHLGYFQDQANSCLFPKWNHGFILWNSFQFEVLLFCSFQENSFPGISLQEVTLPWALLSRKGRRSNPFSESSWQEIYPRRKKRLGVDKNSKQQSQPILAETQMSLRATSFPPPVPSRQSCI